MAERSAVVILRAPGDETATPATAADVAGRLPADDEVATARRAFESLGFEVAPAVATSFSISGSEERFRATFGPAVDAVDAAGGREVELPLDPVPEEARRVVRAVVCTAAPDFGPGNP
jgi:hypothetical protein